MGNQQRRPGCDWSGASVLFCMRRMDTPQQPPRRRRYPKATTALVTQACRVLTCAVPVF